MLIVGSDSSSMIVPVTADGVGNRRVHHIADRHRERLVALVHIIVIEGDQ